ncbi:MAG TPA: M20/M25/M40 family metallo-hydrolase [Capillimicrobium sp.]|nr:M20/M25/M40 family metallo-hydrolase [Capillimicrobium sp.]
MRPWIAEHAAEIAARAERELEALVAVSSPSGDVEGAEECISVVGALVPSEAATERVPCSSPGHADDLIVRLPGTGTRRILLLGHVDTVVAHEDHRPLLREQDRLIGSGAVDMKGGDVLAIGVLRALAERREDFAEVALLLVCDEEWRSAPFAHVDTFAGWDACLCFEGGQLDGGNDAVVVRRKAAGTLLVRATGASSHSGSAPERGRNALLALATAAQLVAGRHDPTGPDRLTAVPTVLRSGDAFNVVPSGGELYCDLRSDRTEAFHDVLASLPGEIGGAELHAEFERIWPAMDARDQTAPLLEEASRRLGRPIVAASRGGASDASHFAPVIPLTVDGLGPRGGGAHAPHEFVLRDGLRSRAEVALAIVDALL